MNQEKLLRKIKEEFPRIKWKSFRYVGNGWDYDVIILDEKIVFRFPKDANSKKKFLGEIKLLDYLGEKINLKIPKYSWIAKKDIFAGYEMIKGEALSPGNMKKMKIENRKRIIKQIARFFTIIHKLPMNNLKKIGVNKINTVAIYNNLNKATEKYFPNKISRKDHEKIKRFLPILKKTFKNYPNEVFIHGDVSGSNILVLGEKISGIIDFSDGGIFDPAMDFSRLWEYGSKFVKEVYYLYNGEKDSKFMERSKIYYKMTALWVLFSGCRDCPIKFEDGYKIFKERF